MTAIEERMVSIQDTLIAYHSKCRMNLFYFICFFV